jgi:hypothetical protein
MAPGVGLGMPAVAQCLSEAKDATDQAALERPLRLEESPGRLAAAGLMRASEAPGR